MGLGSGRLETLLTRNLFNFVVMTATDIYICTPIPLPTFHSQVPTPKSQLPSPKSQLPSPYCPIFFTFVMEVLSVVFLPLPVSPEFS
jgi:hypothetical protein